MDDFETELRKSFLDEAAQLLSETEQCFLLLESSSGEAQTIEKIFRLAHSLKGSAGAVGFAEVSRFSHSFESLLIKIKNRQISVDRNIVNLMLKCNDHLIAQVNALRNGLVEPASDALIAEISQAIDNQAPSKSSDPNVESAPMAQTTATSIVAASAPQTPPAAVLSVKQETAQTTDELHLLATPKIQKGSAGGAGDESLRVSVAKLENLLNNVGELVILQTVLNENKLEIPSPLVQRTITQLGKITKDLQEISMSLRMVPLKPTFLKMQRIVRDSSRLLNKTIRLEMRGEDTEIDKTLLERLSDPLVHLIRNAVDHGIDSAEDRAKAGKTPEGCVQLSAFHRGERVVVEVRDDGQGMDPDKIRAKAIEKGLLAPGQILSQQEGIDLIFLPGFTTKTEVTDLSGRGVGMDVVKTNIEELNGEVQVETEVGRGTCFRILLPLTMAIVDGMVVTTGNQRYIVPAVNVHESVQPEASMIYELPGIGEVLHLRGENIALHRLREVLGLRHPEKPFSQSIAIVVRDGNKTFAVLVDDILGQQQVVIKRLGPELRSLRGFIGGAIMGDGRAALIIDLSDLIYGSGLAA